MLAVLDNLGREDEYRLGSLDDATSAIGVAYWRILFKVVKYTAEPRPVRRVEGTVPLQKAATTFGALAISLIVARIDCEPDC
jgi:hypothetical protein